MPSNEERSGNFSDVCPGCECRSIPATSRIARSTHPLDLFPEQHGPDDSQAQTLLPLIPQPTLDRRQFLLQCRARRSRRTGGKNWSASIRTSPTKSASSPLHSRFLEHSHPDSALGHGAAFPTVRTNFVGPGVSMVANLTSTLSPTLLNEFIFSYTTDHIFLNAIGPVAAPQPTSICPVSSTTDFAACCRTWSIAEYERIRRRIHGVDTGYFPWNNANPTFTYKDNSLRSSAATTCTWALTSSPPQKNEDELSSRMSRASSASTEPASVSTGNGFADFLHRPDLFFRSDQPRKPSITTAIRSSSLISRTTGTSPRG